MTSVIYPLLKRGKNSVRTGAVEVDISASRGRRAVEITARVDDFLLQQAALFWQDPTTVEAKSAPRSLFAGVRQENHATFAAVRLRRRKLKRSFATHPASHRAAFTLIELMVVVGIIVALVALVVPAITSLSSATNLGTGGRLVSNVLAAARADAINQRRRVQFRVATRWLNRAGIEETSFSYRRFSVWSRIAPEDASGSSTPADPYSQISPWETLPTGIAFESDISRYANLPSTGSTRDPGTFFLTQGLGNTKTGVRVQDATVEVAWIEFTPTGATSFPTAAPAKVYMLLTEGFWNGTSTIATHKDHPNWLITAVETLVGRISIVQP